MAVRSATRRLLAVAAAGAVASPRCRRVRSPTRGVGDDAANRWRQSNTACIRVNGDDTQFAASTSLSAETRYLQSGTTAGVTNKYAARRLTFPLDAGSHTISMRYGSVGGTSNFNNRNLYVTVFHPTAP